jgi:2-isopropylmalate synthase
MATEPATKYRPFIPVRLPDRTWPDQEITRAPIWCSVDLRDGNQALAIPMSVEEKLRFFDLLVRVGFKQIEVGFPSASQTEFDFIRRLIEENRVPDDVTLQVLVQAREDLIHRSFESLVGAKSIIMHMYNSTSPAQREQVFGLSKEGIIEMARRGTQWVKDRVHMVPGTHVTYQYSPESFSLTEVEFAKEICEAVMDVWQPTPEAKMILNLPATVEIFTPNVHADQIEWFCRNVKNRESVIISLHTHNDRGTGTAATELALMAGADRVEGTLFGNGERTGNLDIVTVALNMYTQGVDPQLDFSDLPAIRDIYEACTRMRVPERQPYGGDLVFTAFSGSHQDAINKGFKWRQKHGEDLPWTVPYLAIDPSDIGRTYDAIIRINSQSGKGGVAYVLETDYGLQLPKAMHGEIGKVVNQLADKLGREITPPEIYDAFSREYLTRETPWSLKSFRTESSDAEGVKCFATLVSGGREIAIRGGGNGPIQAFVDALRQALNLEFEFLSYSEHSLSAGARAKAIAYVQIKPASGPALFGAGIDSNIDVASIRAVLSAVNRSVG